MLLGNLESKYPTLRLEGIFDLISVLLAGNVDLLHRISLGFFDVPFIGSTLIMIYLLSFHTYAVFTGDNTYLITSDHFS